MTGREAEENKAAQRLLPHAGGDEAGCKRVVVATWAVIDLSKRKNRFVAGEEAEETEGPAMIVAASGRHGLHLEGHRSTNAEQNKS